VRTGIEAVLREAREQRGISVEELSRRTKIGVSTLHALERGQTDRLPGGIFVRGFLRAYAREVGLDSEDIVRRYLAQVEPPSDAAPAVTPETPPSRQVWQEYIIRGIGLFDQRPLPTWMLIVGAAIVIGMGYVAVRGSRTPELLEQPVAQHSPPPALAVAADAEIGTSGRQDVAASADQVGRVVRLEILTSGPCWIAANADGQTVVYRLMLAGERHVIEARDRIVLRVGDPASFTYRINDMPGRPLGPPGQPVTIHIDLQTYREFLSPPA
jgi:transcriptional regulator with XRE-family HTH domain